MDAKTKTKSATTLIAKRFMLLFLPLFIMSTAISTCIVIGDIKIEEETQASREFHNADLLKWTVLVDLKIIISDLRALASRPQLRLMLDSSSLVSRRSVEREFAAFSDRTALYHQIRILNKVGQDLIRVDYRDGKTVVIPTGENEDRTPHPFFAHVFELEEGEVFICPAAPGTNHSTGEQLHNRDILFGTPLFDSQENKTGIAFLHFPAEKILRDLERMGRRTGDRRNIVLLCGDRRLGEPLSVTEPRSSDQENRDDTFSNLYPHAWKQIVSGDSGQVSSRRALFTFTTFSLPGKSNHHVVGTTEKSPSPYDDTNPCPPFWKIVSIVPASVMIANTKQVLIKWLPVYGLFTALLLFVSWHLARVDVERKRMEERLRMLATTDDLTGINNRRQYVDLTKREIRRSRRYGSSLSLIMIDVDHFKKINDSYGHPVGDEVLEAFARTCEENTREHDVLGRMGGDEFAISLLECELNQAMILAERLCESVSQVAVSTNEGDIKFSISAGVAQLIPSDEDMASLLRRADQALYAAKREGRNRVAAAE